MFELRLVLHILEHKLSNSNRLFWELTNFRKISSTKVWFTTLGLRIPSLVYNVKIQDFLTHAVRTEVA